MKKAQIDVALAIGAIIIPLAALMGSLVFAWAIISPLSDACRIAGVIAYDMSTLVDIAYAVPDDIIINYIPASSCVFSNRPNEGLICMNGFMNISAADIMFRVNTISASMKTGYTQVPASIESSVGMTLSPDAMVVSPTYPARVEMPAYVNMKDAGIAVLSGGEFSLNINKKISLSKTRTGLYDTIYSNSPKDDFLLSTVELAYQACHSANNKSTSSALFSPHFYNITKPLACGYYCAIIGSCLEVSPYDIRRMIDSCSDVGCYKTCGEYYADIYSTACNSVNLGASSGRCVNSTGAYTGLPSATLCVHRLHQSPLDIYSNGTAYENQSEEYCFDFNKLTNPNCTFVVDSTFDSANWSKPQGTYFVLSANVTCLDNAGADVTCIIGADGRYYPTGISPVPAKPYKVTLSKKEII